MNNKSQSQSAAQAPFINVTYFPNITVFGSLSGVLEITPDKRLRLTTAEGTQEAPIYKEVLNVSLGEVTKVASVLDNIHIYANQKKYAVSVSQYATPAIAAAGAIGMVAAQRMYSKTGAKDWLNTLKDNGVKVTRFGFGKIWLIATGATLALIAVIIAVTMIPS